MVFLKPLKDLEFVDIEQLKSNKTCESDILDYKEQLLKDEDLLKHVSSFANNQGGYLIFGVKETGKGGYPEEILGIDRNQVNKERIEQVILSSIQPRLDVKIQQIDHQDPSKVFVVIQIPNSYLKPHMNRQGDRFYKRYNFEAMPMTEIEVNDAYKRRFTGYQEVESYLSKLFDIKGFKSPQIIGQIAVIPTTLRRMVETSNMKEFEWMNQLSFKPKERYLPSPTWTPSSNGIKSQFLDKDGHVLENLEIHRNGCVHYINAYLFGATDEDKLLFLPLQFCVSLMHTLQFASTVYQRCNYFGDAKIVCSLYGLENSVLPRGDRVHLRYNMFPCQVSEINIAREFLTNIIESKYEFITSGIMDDIFNSYGLWKCPYFDDKGNFKEDSIR
jgi:hypothetical protein